mgnify:CR=1 FL=1|jgi:uncharacterized phage protein (TIGR02218 family)
MTTDQSSTICTLIKITRTDGVVLGLTDLDIDVVYAGQTYISASGYTPTDYESSSDLSVSNADISGLFDAANISKDEVAAGLFDHAELQISLHNWDANTPIRSLARGWWGEVKLFQAKYVAEFRSLSQQMNNTIVNVLTNTCNAQFCDDRCTLNAVDFTYTGAVTSLAATITSVTFGTDLVGYADDVFRFGKITFTSGANSGQSFDIKRYVEVDGVIQLYSQTAYNVQIGDQFSIIEGCDKLVPTCVGRSNIDNYRGFPSIPNPDKAFKIYSE